MKQEKRTSMTKEIRTLKDAVKNKCCDCMCGAKRIDCEIYDCSLYKFRSFKKDKPKN